MIHKIIIRISGASVDERYMVPKLPFYTKWGQASSSQLLAA